MKRLLLLLCGWVLWSKEFKPEFPSLGDIPRNWTFTYYAENAFETRTACLDALETKRQERPLTLLCLPDTVNPNR